ncbi:MAG: hypothetical protein ACXACI_10300 [Candidatus Hodarchaeales archaeon]|jgi:hypothetical protein
MKTFQKSVERISKELAEMDIQLKTIIEKAKDTRVSPTNDSTDPQKVSMQVVRQQESLLGPLLDATKMSLKLIQANSLELLSSLQNLIPADSDLHERLRDLEQKLHIKLNQDIENRAIEMVRANREFANLVTEVVMNYVEDFKSRELRELQERQAILRDKKEEYTRLLNEMRIQRRQLEGENVAVKEELSAAEAERDRLEKILNNLLKEIRLVRLSEDIEPPDLPSGEATSVAPFQEVYELYRCSLSILKFGALGSEVVVTEKLAFMPPETTLETQDYWLTNVGAYYLTIVGQGEAYASGLFGPLPVRDYDDYLAYVYSFMTIDPSNLDVRSQGKSYALICMFFPKTISVAYSSFQLMKNTLDFVIGESLHAENLNSDFLGILRESLMGILTEKALDGSNIERETDLKMEEALIQSGFWRIAILALDRPTLERSLASLLDQIWSTLQSFDAKSLKITFSNGAEILGKQIRDSSRRLRFGNPWRNIDAAIVFLSGRDTSWTEAQSLVTEIEEAYRHEIPLAVCDSPPTAGEPISAVKKHVLDFVENLVKEKRIARTPYSGEISSAVIKKAILALGSKNRQLNLVLSQNV